MEPGLVAATVDGSEDDLRSLASWLRDEDEFRGRIRLEEKPVAPGEMGGALDAVVMVLTSGTASALVTSIFAWLAQRREVSKVSLKVRNAAGEEVELSCGTADDAARLTGSIRALLDHEG